ncbi:MAG: FtsQ-type POTRA domain-containing protein [Oscillospiraceae bacterium]|nr:FtsQ-type POTRA domain-containing protein [Oscillospiraceae bacterium]
MATSRKNQPPSSKHGEYKKPRKRTVSGAILTFAVVVIAIVFLMSVFLRISDISVEGNEHYTDDEIIKAIDIEQGDNLFFFDRFAAISRVFAKLPYVEEVALERQLPNKVIITVRECKALAYIAVGDENWTIDRSGKVLGKATENELGSLICVEGLDPGTLLIGERLTSADGDESIITFISDVLYQIQERNMAPHILGLDFSDPLGAKMQYGTRFTVIIGGKSEVNHKFAMIESVLDQLKEGDSGVINVSDGSVAHFVPQ